MVRGSMTFCNTQSTSTMSNLPAASHACQYTDSHELILHECLSYGHGYARGTATSRCMPVLPAQGQGCPEPSLWLQHPQEGPQRMPPLSH